MRIRISHETEYSYERAASYAIETLRMTPRSHAGQFVCRWRIDIDADCRLDRDEDSFGNITHTFTVDGPFDRLRVHVEGEVETEYMGGQVRETAERLPPAFYLRETPATAAGAALRAYAVDMAAGEGGDMLATLHAFLRDLPRRIAFDLTATRPETTADEAFALGRGVCQDFAHVFIAGARHLGVPARYVSGYLFKGPDEVTQEAGHAWAEAYLPSLGWVGFDAANGHCVTEHHVRVATGLDRLGSAPIRGARTGGGLESLAVKVLVEPAVHRARPLPPRRPLPGGQTQLQSQAQAQAQSQSQS